MEPIYLEMSQVKENVSHSVELQWTSVFLQVLWSSKSNNSESEQPEQVLTVQEQYLDPFAIAKAKHYTGSRVEMFYIWRNCDDMC